MSNGNSLDQSCCILAVDPGVNGAVACVERNSKGKPIRVFLQSILTREHPFGPIVDTERMLSDMDGMPIPDIILFEEPFAVYAQRGKITTSARTIKVSLTNFGRIQSVVERVTGIYDWLTVQPSVWKSVMGLTKDKKKSLALARELFPMAADLLTKVKDHDRAEALLLAEYAYWNFFRARSIYK